MIKKKKKSKTKTKYPVHIMDKMHPGKNRKGLKIGRFDSEIEAAKAYDKKAIELFKDLFSEQEERHKRLIEHEQLCRRDNEERIIKLETDNYDLNNKSAILQTKLKEQDTKTIEALEKNTELRIKIAEQEKEIERLKRCH